MLYFIYLYMFLHIFPVHSILQLYQTRETALLLPVLATMLHFSPAEVERCQEAGAHAELQRGALAARKCHQVEFNTQAIMVV